MRKIILASGSPRRQELLTAMRVPFTVIPSDYDEQLDDARTPEEVAAELGMGKAQSVAAQYPDAIVIGSDTIVCAGTQQIGKQPTEAAEREVLKLLSSQPSRVTSSAAVVCKEAGFSRVATDSALVVFKPYDAVAVEAYIQTGDWRDKAAYGIQSGAGPLIDYIEGEYDTILGLPTRVLADILAELGVATQPVVLDSPVRRKRD